MVCRVHFLLLLAFHICNFNGWSTASVSRVVRGAAEDAPVDGRGIAGAAMNCGCALMARDDEVCSAYGGSDGVLAQQPCRMLDHIQWQSVFEKQDCAWASKTPGRTRAHS